MAVIDRVTATPASALPPAVADIAERGERRGQGEACAGRAGDDGVIVQRLSRRYGDRLILEGVDLHIAPGQFLALLGRSGSGKSTLLRALAHLDQDTAGAGRITVPARRAVLFQDSRLLPWLRVLDNVKLGALGPDAEARARAALAEVGLAGRERAWPRMLSGGEQQRVALARGLVRDPRFILADEPFSALDALTRLRMQQLLLQVCERHAPAVLFVTHDVDEALLLADRVIVLESGRLSLDRLVPTDDADAGEREALRIRILNQLGVAPDAKHRAAGRQGKPSLQPTTFS
ncbi:ABC transporter ATP-binding protein [Achromobacter aloeverae]|uniref:Sulfonate ABC transporter ATP-binding protein n=1 Tax=Achromobacter aloeverae TaxID=1750518 RepID=A0A4Q1HNA0_9BURK|nr:ABC transporter ATP-binding protein [Achromobacter aloeverae]RXN92257.1 sulfonate ABC transporter ATP-binding protein [Achromobacter aloeverae]